MTSSSYGKPNDDGEGCASAFFSLVFAVAIFWFGFMILDYFIAQKRALNACPTSAVQHIAYHDTQMYWPFGMYATVRCVDGHTVKVGTDK